MKIKDYPRPVVYSVCFDDDDRQVFVISFRFRYEAISFSNHLNELCGFDKFHVLSLKNSEFYFAQVCNNINDVDYEKLMEST